MRALLLVVMLVGSMAQAHERLPWVEGPTPEGYELRQKPRIGLLVSGSVVFAASWVLGGLWATVGLDRLTGFIPVVGPLLAAPVFFGRSGSEASGVLCITASVLQLAGLVAIPLSILFPTRWFERVAIAPLGAGVSVAVAF